jgi:hypothetical protein
MKSVMSFASCLADPADRAYSLGMTTFSLSSSCQLGLSLDRWCQPDSDPIDDPSWIFQLSFDRFRPWGPFFLNQILVSTHVSQFWDEMILFQNSSCLLFELHIPSSWSPIIFAQDFFYHYCINDGLLGSATFQTQFINRSTEILVDQSLESSSECV